MVPAYVEKFCLDPDTTFAALMALPWLSVRQARREYFMSPVPRTYVYGSGEHAKSYDSAPYTAEVQGILDRLNALSATSYDVCFLNRYDTPQDQLGWHADDSPTMDMEHPIAVVSFGFEREIWWRFREAPGTVPPENRQLLEHGSLFIMPAGFQREHQHRIPKSGRACTTRISLTFRHYVEPKKE